MYRKLTLQQMPRIVFAHAYTTNRYDLSFPMQVRRLELTYFEKGNVLRIYEDGTRQSIPEGSFQLYGFERLFRMISDAPLCRHITVGFDTAYTSVPVS